jgi:arylformamidase
MKISYAHLEKIWEADLSRPIDLSIPMSEEGPRAWYVQAPRITPVMENGFVGSIALGGKVNFFNIQFNPHGNGTHTETLGHIDPNKFPISDWKGPYFAHALLVTITPRVIENEGVSDEVVQWDQIKSLIERHRPKALVIRTQPNTIDKRGRNYSNTHFPYLSRELGAELNRFGVIHLLVDLPSVDREEDGGELACHHAFWGFPQSPRHEATITEMIFVEDNVEDGLYCLSIQPPSFKNDAAPSRPILYPLHQLK